jgi:phosphoserine aminotransferase
VALVPASDTGAMEMAMWSMLGARPVDVLYWESFGKGWATDISQQLKLEQVRTLSADYGSIVDLTEVNQDHDVVFTWNGTTSGVRVPGGDWIADDRTGLTFCDATSAVFAQPLPWHKLDVTTYSWQKVLGGEGAHGMLILSPKAVERLETYVPPRPLPKLFRMTKNGKLNEALFRGVTINTPSMLCVADYLDALEWVKNMGGVSATQARCDQNLAVIADFVTQHDWIAFLAEDPLTRSNTSVCLCLDLQDEQIKTLVSLLEKEEVAYDIGAYRDAPAGLRIWCGATVENSDLQALMPWLEWAYQQVKTAY